ncbi:MAG: M1 family metallopeptidase, partial [Chloroflexota bacterium]|nr:M1 family metallopeptidase [Chloroflexota bacterium]
MMNTSKIQFFIILLLLLATLIGCTPSPDQTLTPALTPSPQDTATVTPSPTAEPTPTSTPLPLNEQQTKYVIDVTVNYYNRFITANSRAIYTNKSTVALDEIVFIVYPALYQAIYTRSVRQGDNTPIDDYEWEGHHMVIPLDDPLQPGETIEFIHDFELYMPDRGGVFSQNGEELNLSYWFPFIPPYDETEGWLAHDPQLVNSNYIGEYLVFEAADFDITLQFTDRRENFNIAAPALPQEENGVIHYQLELARTFTFSISDRFVVTEREVNGTKIQAFTLSGHAPVGEDVADVAVQALTLYSELYGDYPRDTLSVVEFNADIGMEFDGLIFLSPTFYNLYPGTPKSNIHVYTAHEISHQWFFSLVGNDQAMEPWLDEALATFSERLFYERYYPDHFEWYLENYITAHNPYGKIDISIYYGGDLFDYRDIVYRNGSLFIQDLREAMGDEAFFQFVQDYVRQYQYQIASAEGFFTVLRQHTDMDLTP